MEKVIRLEFDKTVTRLAGYPYGKQVYETQVGNTIDFTQGVQIEFPEQIVSIASSFVQGFFDEIVKKVGILGVGKQVIVVAPSIDVEEKIIKNLQ